MRRVLTLLAVTSSIALGILSASAADLAVPYKAPPPPPVFTWTGWYVGINGGGGWGQTDHTLAAGVTGLPTLTTNNFNVDGGLAGGTLGYNYQITNWVLGIETDLDWANIQGTYSVSAPLAPHVTGSLSTSSQLNWLDTVRVRVGWAWGHALFYGTGGGAFGGLTVATTPSITFPAGAAFVNIADTQTRLGWTAGAGFEYAFTDNVTARVEYLYVDLGTQTQELVDSVKFYTNLVRGGVDLKF